MDEVKDSLLLLSGLAIRLKTNKHEYLEIAKAGDDVLPLRW